MIITVTEGILDISFLNYYAEMQSKASVSDLHSIIVFLECVDYLKDKDYTKELVTDADGYIVLYRAKDAIWAQFKIGKHSGKYVCVYTYNPSYIGEGYIQYTPEYPMEQKVFPPQPPKEDNHG
jgi:hypothetical protein